MTPPTGYQFLLYLAVMAAIVGAFNVWDWWTEKHTRQAVQVQPPSEPSD